MSEKRGQQFKTLAFGKLLGFLTANRRICWLAFAAELRFKCLAIQPSGMQLCVLDGESEEGMQDEIRYLFGIFAR